MDHGGMMGHGMGSGGMMDPATHMGGGMMDHGRMHEGAAPHEGGAMSMSMHGDEASAADMRLVHELLAAHEAIERTVTHLPDGVHAVTESSIPEVTTYIKAHVASMQQRMLDGEVFNVASPTIPILFANADRIHTVIEETPRGVVFTQTTGDPELVPVLQAHAAEVTELVREGMAAMMRSMMQGGGAVGAPASTMPAGGAAAGRGGGG
jgi:hypothetical protein